MGIELLFLLLPVAAFSGWLLGRSDKRRKRTGTQLNPRYYQGLNYLLDEQPDEALDVFIGLSELDSDSVEIQFALAALFLRRGEVERAIRIHQNLIARPTLSAEHKRQALFALAKDYMGAGLLDRAENLFLDLSNDPVHGAASRQQLLEIFQREKEWRKAIGVAEQLRGNEREQYRPVLAHYYCELAELDLKKGDWAQMQQHLRQAIDSDRNSVRASLLEARRAIERAEWRQAIQAASRVESQDPDYLPLVLEPLHQAYVQLERGEEFVRYLEQLAARFSQQPIGDYLVTLYMQRGAREQAQRLLEDRLAQQASLNGLARLIGLLRDRQGGEQPWQQLHEVSQRLIEHKPSYQCRDCGYQGRTMLWQCPSCKHWNSIKPV